MYISPAEPFMRGCKPWFAETTMCVSQVPLSFTPLDVATREGSGQKYTGPPLFLNVCEDVQTHGWAKARRDSQCWGCEVLIKSGKMDAVINLILRARKSRKEDYFRKSCQGALKLASDSSASPSDAALADEPQAWSDGVISRRLPPFLSSSPMPSCLFLVP